VLGFAPLGTCPLGAVPPAEEVERAIASTDWTGRTEAFVASPDIADAIRGKLDEVEVLLRQSGLRTEDVAKGVSQAEAMRRLVSGPEPELRAAARVLTSILDSAWVKRSGTVAGLGRLLWDILRLLFG
jgi:hypothetical protein